MPNHKICLASQSPRRRELLSQIGIDHIIVNPGIDEALADGELPLQYVLRMALEKARAGWALNNQHGSPVLAADTCVVHQGKVMGKPQDRQQALDMLQSLSGSTHEVLSAVAMVGIPAATSGHHGYKESCKLNSSLVSFKETSESERNWYWQTGEPADKAGSYGIQGLGAVFIRKIEGSYSGIMGLPLFEAYELLVEFGVEIN